MTPYQSSDPCTDDAQQATGNDTIKEFWDAVCPSVCSSGPGWRVLSAQRLNRRACEVVVQSERVRSSSFSIHSFSLLYKPVFCSSFELDPLLYKTLHRQNYSADHGPEASEVLFANERALNKVSVIPPIVSPSKSQDLCRFHSAA